MDINEIKSLTPEEVNELNKKLSRQIVVRFAAFAGLKAAVIVGSLLIARRLSKKIVEVTITEE